MSGHGFTYFGAFPGAFVFTEPNIGNLVTASAIGNCETSVYVVLVSRMSLCRIGGHEHFLTVTNEQF